MSETNQSNLSQIRVPAMYYRGGTSKGVFFRQDQLPPSARQPGPGRDAFLLRVIGSPDPYAKQIDGMGGASSSTSKTVILAPPSQPDHDVDYLFGQVAIDRPVVDWSGNCGNLSAAVAAFAIQSGLIDKSNLPRNGVATVRIWQVNISKTIVAHIPMRDGEVLETGDFELDGVTFPAAEIVVEFMDPADGEGALLPTGQVTDSLEVPGIGSFRCSLINAGIPTVFIPAEELGLVGSELQEAVNQNDALLQRLETVRQHASVKMGLVKTLEEASQRQHTPKIAWVAPALTYSASSGKTVAQADIDLVVRAMSMGKLHHAMMGTAAVAIAAASAIPGTVVNDCLKQKSAPSVTFGHPSGTLTVGAEARESDGQWQINKAIMSRSARILMEGWVRVPAELD